MILKAGRIVLPQRELVGGWVQVEAGKIAAIGSGQAPGPAVDLGELTLIPGLIDLHVHGGGGADTMDATPQALQTMARLFASAGVTGFLPTTMSASQKDIARAVENVGKFMGQAFPEAARILGVHVEGPFIASEYKGAQPENAIRPGTRTEIDQLYELLPPGGLKLLTLAPELPGHLALIGYLASRGTYVAAGHSDATYAQMQEAVRAGLSQVTHTGNGMRPFHHREPGILGAALSLEGLKAQIISDGIHLHPATVKLFVQSRGADDVILITDGLKAMGYPDGEYDFGGEKMIVKGLEARRPSGSLCGSVITMIQEVQNACNFAQLNLWQAVRAASLVPAQAIGVCELYGSIEVGKAADLVAINSEFQVERTYLEGELIYRRGNLA
mgnify:CR=1 FL=1